MRSFLLTSLPLKYSEPHIKIFRLVFELINNLSFAFKHKWWNFLNGLSVEDIYQNKVVVYPHSLFLKQNTLAHYLNIPHSTISVIIVKPWNSFCRVFAEQKTVSQSHTLFTKSSQHIKPELTTVLLKSTWLQRTPISLDCWTKCTELGTSCSKHTQLEKCKLRKLSLPQRYSSYFLIPSHTSSKSLRITLWNLHYSCALLAWLKLFINSM